MGAFGDLPHGRWVRDPSPGLRISRDQRSLIAGLATAGALSLLIWRAMAEIASGSDARGVSVGTAVPGLSANDRRYALLVAVERYDDAALPSLESPTRDTEELHAALVTHAGFPPANIRRVDGSGPDAMVPTRSNVLRAFHELLAEIPEDGNAMVLVAFTGQGLSADGKAYLLPRDAITRGGASLLARTAIDFDADIKERLVARRIRQLVLLVDSTVGDSARAASARRLTPEFVKATRIDLRPPMQAIAVVHATSAGASSYTDPAARRSLFTHALVEGVRGAASRSSDGWITLGSLLRYVLQTVPGDARRIDASLRQEPTASIDGFLPDEIRFARVAPRTASSSGDLRCALRTPSSRGDLYVFDVTTTGSPRAGTAVEAVRVVNGGVMGTPFGRPVPLTGPREWPIRRTAASAPLLAIAQTNIGQCAAYVEAAPAQSPVYRLRWQATNAEGVPYKEVFKHPTENRQGRTDVIAAGADTLRDHEGRIMRVEYACEGAFCGWSYHPDPARGYAGDVTLKDSGNAFSWRRRWEGDPAMDTYTAYYEMPVRACVSGCP